MKKFILCSIFIPFAGKFLVAQTSTVLAEVRSGEWPISLKKSDKGSGTNFSLQFRDQQVLTNVLLDTLPFHDLTQLKYLEKALTVLKTGNNGDIAKFKDYSIKRIDSRTDGRTYLLRYQWGLTNFKQTEADILISAIKKL